MFRRRTQEQAEREDRVVDQLGFISSRRLTDGDRVIRRAMALMEAGKARSWSHAIAIAAETLPREQGERNA